MLEREEKDSIQVKLILDNGQTEVLHSFNVYAEKFKKDYSDVRLTSYGTLRVSYPAGITSSECFSFDILTGKIDSNCDFYFVLGKQRFNIFLKERLSFTLRTKNMSRFRFDP